MVEYTTKTISRFWNKVNKTDTCWLWTSATASKGYGVLTVNNKLVYAHRMSYELAKGPIPEGLVLDHFYCQNPPCVNPDHLEAVTSGENIRRAFRGGHVYKSANCKHGHPRIPENTMMTPKGPVCKICNRETSLRYFRKYKAVRKLVS